MKTHSAKSGQAMIEFLVGLIGIMILVLALSQIATVVNHDMVNILNARIDVAEDLVNSSTSRPNSPYDPSGSYIELDQNINGNSDGAYEGFQSSYPQSARNDGFGFLSNGVDPLNTMMGSQKSHMVEIGSQLMQEVFGSSSFSLSHEVWMPPWDDLQ